MGKRANIQAEDRFGYLTVIREVEPNVTPCGTVQRKFLCRCDCGNEVIRLRSTLQKNPNPSCGCMELTIGDRTRKYTKEQTSSFLYSTWNGMKQRCLDPNSSHYHRYGGRGVTICEEWLNDYSKFYEWAMANGASKELTLDRIDTDGNYEPSNCRWADVEMQMNNTSQNRFIEYNGEKLTVMQWSRRTGIEEGTIRRRLDSYGYSVAEALGYETHTKKSWDRSHTRKPVNQYSLDGEFIREWPSIQEAADTLNIRQASIRACATGYYKSGGGFIWRYLGEQKKHKRNRKAVLQFNFNGILLAEYEDAKEASEKTGIGNETIRDFCNGRRKTTKHTKFIWKYKEDYERGSN